MSPPSPSSSPCGGASFADHSSHLGMSSGDAMTGVEGMATTKRSGLWPDNVIG